MALSVFLGWSGESSRRIATALRFWLSSYSADLAPWTSDFDLTPGRAWFLELRQKLMSADAGILCVTADNQREPWMNFEAGALWSIEKLKVIPYLLGSALPSAKDSPLVYFQAVPATRDGTRHLLKTLLATAGSPEPNARLFQAFWPLLERAIRQVVANDSSIDGTLHEIENLCEARRSLALRDVRVSPERVRRGGTLQIEYGMESAARDVPLWLGACLWLDVDQPIFNTRQDVEIDLRSGYQRYSRQLRIPAHAAPGRYNLSAEIWYGPISDPDDSFPLQELPFGRTVEIY